MLKEKWDDVVTEQQLFDHVLEHLRQQKRRCFNQTGASIYTTDDFGCQCAAGCLLTKDELHLVKLQQVNWKSWSSLVNLRLVPERLKPHHEFILALQSIHDTSMWEGDKFLEEINRKMLNFAQCRNLNTDAFGSR